MTCFLSYIIAWIARAAWVFFILCVFWIFSLSSGVHDVHLDIPFWTLSNSQVDLALFLVSPAEFRIDCPHQFNDPVLSKMFFH
jgi:hypothetical protein